MMKTDTLFEHGPLPPYVHLASTRRHSCDSCSQAFPVFATLPLLNANRRTENGGGLGTRLIVLYLIGTPGEYTREKLKAYESLDDYNYFTSGWVGTCFIHEVSREFIVLKAAVKSSQSISQYRISWLDQFKKPTTSCQFLV